MEARKICTGKWMSRERSREEERKESRREKRDGMKRKRRRNKIQLTYMCSFPLLHFRSN